MTSLLVALVFVCTAVAAAGPVKLVYVPYYSGDRAIVEQQIVANFNTSHPDIEVQIVDFPGKSIDTVLTRLAAGEQMDIGAFHQNLSNLMWMGHTLELTPLIQKDRFPLNVFRPGSLQCTTYNGRILGLPFGAGGEYLYVNQTLFGQAGVPEPRKGWTAREFEAALPKLTKMTNGNQVTQWGIGYNGGYASGPAPFYLMDGGSFIDNRGRYNLNQEAVHGRLDWLREITAKGLARSGWSGPWENGQMAMALDWEGRVLQHIAGKVHDKFDWRLSYMPTGQAGSFTVLSVHQAVILKQTKHPDEAWTFLKYFYLEGDLLFGQALLYPTTIPGARAIFNKGNEILPPGYDVRSFYAPILDAPDTAFVYPTYIPGWVESDAIINGALQTVLKGEKPARIAFAEIADQVNNTLAEYAAKTAL